MRFRLRRASRRSRWSPQQACLVRSKRVCGRQVRVETSRVTFPAEGISRRPCYCPSAGEGCPFCIASLAMIRICAPDCGRLRLNRTAFRAGHPGWLRCSSLKYSRYSRSSRLAIRAPRAGIQHCFSEDGPLVSGFSRTGLWPGASPSLAYCASTTPHVRTRRVPHRHVRAWREDCRARSGEGDSS